MDPILNKVISREASAALVHVLRLRFDKHRHRHEGLDWEEIESRLMPQPGKLWSLAAMEESGGEPDVIGMDPEGGAFLFCDCSRESPKGRRSLCYDPEALESRKEFKPLNSAIGMAREMGIELMDEALYQGLQSLEAFDTKTSSWLLTPEAVRKLGGGLFGDYRFGRAFVYHNGAESYYAARGFRGVLRV